MKKVISLMLVALFLTSGLVFAEQKGKICVATQGKKPGGGGKRSGSAGPLFSDFRCKRQFQSRPSTIRLRTKKARPGNCWGDF